MLYAEDFIVGRVFELGSWTPSAQEIMEFAGRWDPLPLHTDPRAAAASPFGGLIASGIHTLGMMTRLVVAGFLADSAVVAGREVRSMRMLRPVRAGMTVNGRVEVVDRALRGDAHGVVVWNGELADDAGDRVFSYVVEVLIARRPPRR